MCATCTTAIDMAAANGVVIAAVAINKWGRLRDRLARRSRLERDLDTWERNAAFVKSMGLDPLATLGAPPTLPVPAAADAAATDTAGTNATGTNATGSAVRSVC